MEGERLVDSYHYYDPVHAYFLVFGLSRGVRAGRVKLNPHYEEFDALNMRVLERGDVDVSAVSAVNLWRLADSYYLLRAGSTQRYDVGPIIVSRRPYRKEEINDLTIAVPGRSFSGYFYYRLFFRARDEVVVRYDMVIDAVLKGEADLGLLIPGPSTTMAYEGRGLVKVADINEEWRREAGNLPLPLGSYVVRKRSFSPEEARDVRETFQASIRYAQAHPDEALEYAVGFARGADRSAVKSFIEGCMSIYDMGESGIAAITKVLELAARRGVADRVPRLDIV